MIPEVAVPFSISGGSLVKGSPPGGEVLGVDASGETAMDASGV
jgi:hypothetical protein